FWGTPLCTSMIGKRVPIGFDCDWHPLSARKLRKPPPSFRLFRLTVLVRRKLRRRGVSADMAQHLHTMALLEGFVLGHLKAQTSMVRFFCRGTLDNDEICRVILQSQIQVFCAMQAAVEE
ncbi:unnamed protein product, partial [Effrenium voratum]